MQEIMSKADTQVNCKILWAVLEVVAFIPTRSDIEITKGNSHAIMITIPGRLTGMEVLYLKG